jgi:hypothetical protein
MAEERESDATRFAEVASSLLAGEDLDIGKIECAYRDAALAEGNDAFLSFLSALPEQTPTCPECGAAMKNLGKREKRIVSMLGEGYISRSYYQCEKCGTHMFPKDDALGTSGTSFSPGVKRAVSRLAASEPFESASQALWELCRVNICSKDTERLAEAEGMAIEAERAGMIETAFSDKADAIVAAADAVPVMYVEYDGTGIPVIKKETKGRAGKQEDGSAKTREMKVGCVFTQHGVDENGQPMRDKGSTSYFSAIEGTADFGRRIYAEALCRGLRLAERVVIIGDGAKWIWNNADLHFPHATQIVDLYHAKEHISDLLKAVVHDESEQDDSKDLAFKLLDAGDISSLTAFMATLPVKNQEQRKLVETETAYFTNNAHRMDYAHFKEQGLFVGSGVIEAACKNVIGKRLKQSGMHWSVRGANSIAALRCEILSGRFEGKHALTA